MQGTNKQLSPTTFIKEVESVLPDLTRGEATRLAEHGWAWAVMYYDGGPPTSDTIRESLERSETERQRMRESINPPEPQRETQVEAGRERITEREAYRVG